MRKIPSLTLDTYAGEEIRGEKAIAAQVRRFVAGRRDELSLSWGLSDTFINVIEDDYSPFAIVTFVDGRMSSMDDDLDGEDEADPRKVKDWMSARLGINAQTDADNVYVRLEDVPALVTALMDTTEKEVVESLW